MMQKQNTLLYYGVALLVMVAGIVVLALLDPVTRNGLVRENGLIEQLSVVGYIVCILLLLYQGAGRLERPSYWMILLFLLSLCLRELDFHSRFTTMGITKTRFYISPHVPLYEKLIGLAVSLLFFYIVYYLFRHHFRDFMTGLFNRASWAIGVLLGGCLMVLSKGVDSQADAVEWLFGLVGIDWNPLSVNVEEMMELFIPVMFLLVIVNRFRRRKRTDVLQMEE